MRESGPVPAVLAAGLVRRFGERAALAGADLEVRRGEMFALLGPNGGGKTTLFRILATLLLPSAGRAEIFGCDVARDPAAVRAILGVVFQSPAVDRQLTVRENLDIHGRLYGLSGKALARAVALMLERLRLAERAGERAGVLSGGLLRRVEIAKGLLHQPRLLLLDEPSTGLDPAARADLRALLETLRRDQGVTVVMTTHLLDEAETFDRVAILDAGRVVACGSPAELETEIGGDVIVLRPVRDPDRLRREVETIAGRPARLVDGTVQIEARRGDPLAARLVSGLREGFEAMSLSRPTLLDVFVRRTGHRFDASPADGPRAREVGR